MTDYVIIRTREFYGPSKTRDLLMRPDGQRALTFAARKAAAACIADLDGGVYHLGHNESARPAYSIKRVDALPAYLAAYV